jgi:hypothetical protein
MVAWAQASECWRSFGAIMAQFRRYLARFWRRFGAILLNRAT